MKPGVLYLILTSTYSQHEERFPVSQLTHQIR